MAGSSKVGGGINPMHLTNDKHPFSSGPFRGSQKFSRTRGVGPAPGGEGDKVSANAAMKKKRPLNGPGIA